MNEAARIAALEAEVADLRAQLAAKRRAPAARREAAMLLREQLAAAAIRPFLQHVDGDRHVCQVARLLLHLAERPGRVCEYGPILQAIRDPFGRREPAGGLVKVVLFHARKALLALELGDVIVTLRGRGLVLDAAAAPRVRELLHGGRHG